MALVEPEGGVETGVICGIDPGSQHLGICMLTIRWDDYSVVGVEARTIKAPTHTGVVDVGEELDRWGRIGYQHDAVLHLLEVYRPWIVCCESPFYNRFRPSAYVALVECVYAMRLAVKAYDVNVKFTTYEPAVVKKLVGATAHGNKVAVKTAVGNVAELMSVLNVEVLNGYDEHSVDSVAVAYTHLLKLRRLVVA